MRLGFLGPAGTFTHAALLASRHTAGAEAVPLASEREAVLAAASGAVDAALVPIENVLEGGVNATLDAILVDAPAAHVVGEELLAISQALVVAPGLALEDITAVASHPHALAQCRHHLAELLPGRRTVAATSTSEAVRLVAVGADPWAAIGTAVAAELYGARVLVQGIEDEPGNVTRFWWVAGAAGAFAAVAGAVAKTSLVFGGDGDGTPGWLGACLAELSSRGINLTRIESRPSRQRMGHYLFQVDLDGDARAAPVAAAVEGLRAHCEVVRVLGSYPAAADPA